MCWICSFQGMPLAVRANGFIIKYVGFIDLHCISQQVSDFILTNEPDAPGADKETVFQHVHCHMLHPRVRVAVMLRQLLDFAGLLQNSMVVRDGLLCTVDKGNAELYLKVVGQIVTLYKLDPQSMLFVEDNADAEEKAGAGASAAQT